MHTEKSNRNLRIAICAGLAAALLAVTFILFLGQARGERNADLYTHIQTAISGRRYSLCGLLLRFGYTVGGETGCAILLSLTVPGTGQRRSCGSTRQNDLK